MPDKSMPDNMLYANLRQRVRPNTPTHITRTLPGQGTILVKKGDEVGASDIIGNYRASAGYSSVNVAEKLGVNPKQADKYLQRKIGETIYQGELLATRKTLFGKKQVLAPTDSSIEEYNSQTGRLRLKFFEKETALASGVYGIVDAVDKMRNEIVIRTYATKIVGTFGSGKERGGILHFIDGRDNLVSKTQLDSKMDGKVLVAGALIYGDSLRRAVELGVHGIISGGLNAKDYKSMSGSINPARRIASDNTISVLAIEGFSSIPIGTDVYGQLKSNEGKFIFINGNSAYLLLPTSSSSSIISLRKLVLPVSRMPESIPEIITQELVVGKKIRLIWPPFMGMQGTIVAIDKTVTVLESGISTYLLTIDTPSRKMKVPFPNVELL